MEYKVRHFLVMFGQTSKSHLVFLVALVIGGIGACGQSFLIHHDLVDTYPYKIMSFPSAEFYAKIANSGVYLAPVLAIVSSLLLGLKRFWLAMLVPVVACPLVFAIVFKTLLLMRERSGTIDAGRNFDDTKASVVAQGFYFSMVSYTVAGLIIGVICCSILSWLTKEKKLA